MNNVHSDALTVTQEAQHYILGILKKNNAKYFRISVKTSGCSGLAYDPSVVNEIQPEDILLTVSDQLQIAVDADAVDVLKGTTIDLEKKTLGQMLLVYHNPNVHSSCGCGESFQVKSGSEESESNE